MTTPVSQNFYSTKNESISINISVTVQKPGKITANKAFRCFLVKKGCYSPWKDRFPLSESSIRQRISTSDKRLTEICITVQKPAKPLQKKVFRCSPVKKECYSPWKYRFTISESPIRQRISISDKRFTEICVLQWQNLVKWLAKVSQIAECIIQSSTYNVSSPILKEAREERQ